MVEKVDQDTQEDEETVETDEESEETEEETDAESEATTSKKKKAAKPRKVVRRRKSKKEKERPLAAAIRLAVESGKVEFGSRVALSSGKKTKVFVLAANAQDSVKSALTAHSGKGNVPVIDFEGTSIELGSICGKPFPVSVLSVYEEGSSNILSLLKKK